jgi:hypothetical protein
VLTQWSVFWPSWSNVPHLVLKEYNDVVGDSHCYGICVALSHASGKKEIAITWRPLPIQFNCTVIIMEKFHNTVNTIWSESAWSFVCLCFCSDRNRSVIFNQIRIFCLPISMIMIRKITHIICFCFEKISCCLL